MLEPCLSVLHRIIQVLPHPGYPSAIKSPLVLVTEYPVIE